jgi:hypothetical protein
MFVIACVLHHHHCVVCAMISKCIFAHQIAHTPLSQMMQHLAQARTTRPVPVLPMAPRSQWQLDLQTPPDLPLLGRENTR